jgi:hypothetical protein
VDDGEEKTNAVPQKEKAAWLWKRFRREGATRDEAKIAGWFFAVRRRGEKVRVWALTPGFHPRAGGKIDLVCLYCGGKEPFLMPPTTLIEGRALCCRFAKAIRLYDWSEVV